MPITLHGDLLFINYFPYFLSHRGVWDIYGHFGDHFIRQVGCIYYAPAVYYFIAAGQSLLSDFTPDFAALMERYHYFYYNAISATESDYFQGFSTKQILSMVFWMKMPYGILEAGIFVMIWKALTSFPAERMLALRLWILSPVVIFSTYVMGQHRLLTAFFLWAVLLALRRNRIITASLSMGAACLCDSVCWLFVPAAILAFGSRSKQRVQILCWIAVPVLALLIPLYLSSSGLVTTAYYAPLLQKQAMQGIFRHQIPGAPLALKLLFAAGYLSTLAFLLKKIWRKTISCEERTVDFTIACLAILLMLYATTSTVIHYFMWAMPFVVYFRVFQPKERVGDLVWIVALLFFFNLDSRSLNLGLLSPLGSSYWINQPSWHEWVQPYIPWWGSVIALSRFAFSILCVRFGLKIVKDRFYVKKNSIA